MIRSMILASALSLSASALGQTAPIFAYPPQNDTVNLSLTEEDWVATASARTELAVDASLPGSDAGRVRGDILTAIKGLAQGTEWRFTRFDHDQDPSGLKHWHAVLEARLSEAQLGGLSDRAKQASKPGTQIKIQTIDFSPSLAEIEAAKAKLRGDLYKKINESLVQLNQAEPDRKYRVMSVNFNAQPVTINGNMRAMAAAPASTAAYQNGGAQAVELSTKIQATANITYAALAPRE